MRAFCPAHITCFFSPSDSDDLMRKGSKGAGIRLNLGTTVELDEKSGGRSDISIDGTDSEAWITRYVLESISPDRSFSVDIRNDLPVSQGFSTSASGAVAVALCVCEIAGRSRTDAFGAAHAADILGGGGLGDVSGIMCDRHQPFRKEAGIRDAHSEYTGVSFPDLTVAVLGPRLDTGTVLRDPRRSERITASGEHAVSEYADHPGRDSLFGVSNGFSSGTGLENGDVSRAIELLGSEGIRAAMCMLGNSIFTDAPPETAGAILGDGVPLYRCRSTDASARIIHRG